MKDEKSNLEIGLAQSAAGEVVNLGSFLEYADLEIPEEEVTVRGSRQWRNFIGKSIEFLYSDGFADGEYHLEGEVESIEEINGSEFYINLSSGASYRISELDEYLVTIQV